MQRFQILVEASNEASASSKKSLPPKKKMALMHESIDTESEFSQEVDDEDGVH